MTTVGVVVGGVCVGVVVGEYGVVVGIAQHLETGQHSCGVIMACVYPSGHSISPRSQHLSGLQTQAYEQQHSEIC